MHTEDKVARLQAFDGSRYQGEFKHGLRHGKGEIAYTCSDTFVGDWREGVCVCVCVCVRVRVCVRVCVRV